jgi:hypothetical protein
VRNQPSRLGTLTRLGRSTRIAAAYRPFATDSSGSSPGVEQRIWFHQGGNQLRRKVKAIRVPRSSICQSP